MNRESGSGYSIGSDPNNPNSTSNPSGSGYRSTPGSATNPTGGSTVLGSTTLGAIKDSITGGPRNTEISGPGAGGISSRGGSSTNTGANRQWDKGSEREWNQGSERVNRTNDQPSFSGNQFGNPNPIDPSLNQGMNQPSGNAPIGVGYSGANPPPINNQYGSGSYNKDPRVPTAANTNEMNYSTSGRQL